MPLVVSWVVSNTPPFVVVTVYVIGDVEVVVTADVTVTAGGDTEVEAPVVAL